MADPPDCIAVPRYRDHLLPSNASPGHHPPPPTRPFYLPNNFSDSGIPKGTLYKWIWGIKTLTNNLPDNHYLLSKRADIIFFYFHNWNKFFPAVYQTTEGQTSKTQLLTLIIFFYFAWLVKRNIWWLFQWFRSKNWVLIFKIK
jgi:hypothetical protein